MNINLDQKGLSLAQMLEYMRRDLKLTDMIIVYSNRKELSDYGIYCALIPSRQVDQVLTKSSWDLMLYQHEGTMGLSLWSLTENLMNHKLTMGRERATSRYPRSSGFFTTSITTEKKRNTSRLMMKVMSI